MYVWSQDLDHGSPWRPDRVTHSFERIRDQAGLPTTRFHHLRHFTATMMLASGVDVRTAAGRLGHSDSSVTLRTYAHVLEQRDREAASVLGRLLEDSQPAILT
jgi:integrase